MFSSNISPSGKEDNIIFLKKRRKLFNENLVVIFFFMDNNEKTNKAIPETKYEERMIKKLWKIIPNRKKPSKKIEEIIFGTIK